MKPTQIPENFDSHLKSHPSYAHLVELALQNGVGEECVDDVLFDLACKSNNEILQLIRGTGRKDVAKTGTKEAEEDIRRTTSSEELKLAVLDIKASLRRSGVFLN